MLHLRIISFWVLLFVGVRAQGYVGIYDFPSLPFRSEKTLKQILIPTSPGLFLKTWDFAREEQGKHRRAIAEQLRRLWGESEFSKLSDH